MKNLGTACDLPGPPPWRRPGVLLAALALAGYAVLLALHVGTCAAGADASGYMNHARLLASGHLHAAPRTLPGLSSEEQRSMLFVPLGFVPAPDGNGMVPTYPAGLPMLVAAAASFAGWEHAGDIVLCAHALIGVLLTYVLGRTMGLSRRGAVIGATIVAASPLYLNYSLQMMSDVPALVWTLGAVLAAWRSRERAAWALAAGAATAVGVLIRPTDTLLFAPLAVALGLSPRRWLLLIAGGLPGGIFFCLHSLSLYGRLFTTGYGDIAQSLGPRWIGATLWHYACWLPALFTPVVLLALGLPWLARTQPRPAALLGAWVLVFAAFYSAYACTHQAWWYLRFLLPAVPPLVVGGLLVAKMAGAGRRWPLHETRVFTASMIVILANSSFWNKQLPSLNIGRDNEMYPEIAAWLRGHLPPNTVILGMQMTGVLTYYTDFTFMRWDFCDVNNRPHLLAALRAGERPFYAALFTYETDAALRERMPGTWTRIASLRSNMEIWRFESGGAAGPEIAGATPSNGPPALVWRLPIDQTTPVREVCRLLNVIAWIVLAGLLWRLLPGNDWRDWLARGAVLLSAGAISSIRYALTDLIALTLLAGAILALERRRNAWASGLLGLAGIGRGAALLALPAVAGTPWSFRALLHRFFPVAAFVAAAAACVAWHVGSARQIFENLAWPFGSFLDRWSDGLAAIFQFRDIGLAWVGLVVLLAFTVQAAFFLRYWREGDPWWRLGVAFVVLMFLLNDSMWVGAAGGVSRLLLPLTLAFNLLARRCRAPAAWLLAGNLGVAAGFLSLFFFSDPLTDMAAVRAAGFAQISGADNGWFEGEHSARHAWSWNRGSARLDIETWPHSSRPVAFSFALRSLTPRTVTIRQDGKELWRGEVGRNYIPVRIACHVAEGRAFLDMATDSPAVPDRSGSDARRVAFAIYDPCLAAADP